MPAAPIAGPMPLVRQHPGVGDVAIQAGREHQHHHAHFVAFAAEMFAGQPVAELVQDLGHAQRDAEPEPVVGGEELVERRAAGWKTSNLHEHQRQGREREQHAARPPPAR